MISFSAVSFSNCSALRRASRRMQKRLQLSGVLSPDCAKRRRVVTRSSRRRAPIRPKPGLQLRKPRRE